MGKLFDKFKASKSPSETLDDLNARTKDAMKAQAEIVALARKLESEGKIALKNEGDEEYVV